MRGAVLVNSIGFSPPLRRTKKEMHDLSDSFEFNLQNELRTSHTRSRANTGLAHVGATLLRGGHTCRHSAFAATRAAAGARNV